MKRTRSPSPNESLASRVRYDLAVSAASLEAARRPSPAPQASALDQCDLELAAYLLVRQETGRPVRPKVKALLIKANETKKDVLAMMTYGRGNVKTDLEATQNQGLYRLRAQRHLVSSESSLGRDPDQVQLQDAALSAHFGTGNCGEFANVTAHVHAGRLGVGEHLDTVYRKDRDHTWVMVHGVAGDDGKVPTALLDVWSQGPVMEPQDNQFVVDTTSSPVILQTIDGHNGPSIHERFDEARQAPKASTIKRARALLAAHIRDGKQPPSQDVYERPIVSLCKQFSLAARAAVQKPQCELTLRAQAAALARELKPSLPQADETTTVEAILDIAVKFDQPRERPLPPLADRIDNLTLPQEAELAAASTTGPG